MKKQFVYLLAASLTLGMAAPVFSACGDDDPAETPAPPTTPDTPTPSNPQGDKKLNSTEQKQKLESVAKAFMAEVKANNFTSLKELGQYCSDHYVNNDDFDNDVVTEWFEDALDASCEIVGIQKEQHGSWIESRKLYNRVIALANFTGHFTSQKSSWKKEKASDLQFIFTDQDGKPCNITVTSSGKTKKAYVGQTEDWYDWDYDENKKEYIDYINEYKEYVMVPEHITITLTQNGTKLVETVVNIDLSAFSGPEFDLSKDGLVTEVVAQVGDFTWNVQRAEYSAKNHNASITGYMKKGSSTLATFQAQAADLDVTNESFNDAKKATVTFDLMGQMQIKATCSNAKKYADLIDQAEENDENEPLFKSYINQANELTDIAVFYDKGSIRQASMKLMSFKEESYWSSDSYWYCEPVILFDDDSTYSTFNAYFNEKDFRSVIDTFESLIRGYEDLFEY